jgi:hypothetical protein
MKAFKMALALALTVASTVVAPTAVSANAAASQDYLCFYQYSFEADGWIYDVYYCYPYA